MTEQALLADCLARLNRLPLDYYLTGSTLGLVLFVPVAYIKRFVADFGGIGW
jgi:hypothetical protein